VGFLVAQAVRGYVYNRQMLVASSTLHNKLVARLFQAPMSFFDVTPTGQILARVSKDLDEIDVRVPGVLEQFLTFMSLISITLVMVSVILPWFLVAIPFMFTLYYFVVKEFRPAQRHTKRIENEAAGPVLGLATCFADVSSLQSRHGWVTTSFRWLLTFPLPFTL
jgi:ABC-type multidrug transport system fused ATPase/permease subunit